MFSFLFLKNFARYYFYRLSRNDPFTIEVVKISTTKRARDVKSNVKSDVKIRMKRTSVSVQLLTIGRMHGKVVNAIITRGSL